MITGDNLEVLAGALSGKIKHQLPIVFVSKTKANEPVERIQDGFVINEAGAR